METVGVSEMLYNSLRLLKNPRKCAIFEVLMEKTKSMEKRELTSIDIEARFRERATEESMTYIGTTLKELEGLNLISFTKKSKPKTHEGNRISKGKRGGLGTPKSHQCRRFFKENNSSD